ncbi:uncharacterized protein DS421_7g213720 [Arachis hypogaea]|nr:uncharacterized protein DS421_7g213720 [Arachis hypogaea]
MTTTSSRATAVTAEQRNDGGSTEVTVAGLCGATAREDDEDGDGEEPPAAALAQRRRFSLRDGNGSSRAAVRWRIGSRARLPLSLNASAKQISLSSGASTTTTTAGRTQSRRPLLSSPLLPRAPLLPSLLPLSPSLTECCVRVFRDLGYYIEKFGKFGFLLENFRIKIKYI